MTPLSRFFGKYLPFPISILVLTLVYTFILFVVVAHIGYDAPANVYIDIGR